MVGILYSLALRSAVMKILEMLQDAVQYISEGVGRIFGPSDDQYPATGVQPYEGDSFARRVDSHTTARKG